MSGRRTQRTNNKMRRPKRAQSNRNAIVTTLSTAFPRAIRAVLKYTEMVNITMTTSVAFDYLFNLNSIHDPNRSGTGHQPQSHDDWERLYSRYRVDRVRVVIRPLGSTATTGFKISAFSSNSTVGITAYDQAAEMPYAKEVYCITTGATTGGIDFSVALNKVTGVSKQIYESDDRYQALFGSSPTESICLHVVMEDGAFSNPNIYFNVQLEMETYMFDPKQLGLS